jgi:hypothetical protein
VPVPQQVSTELPEGEDHRMGSLPRATEMVSEATPPAPRLVCVEENPALSERLSARIYLTKRYRAMREDQPAKKGRKCSATPGIQRSFARGWMHEDQPLRRLPPSRESARYKNIPLELHRAESLEHLQHMFFHQRGTIMRQAFGSQTFRSGGIAYCSAAVLTRIESLTPSPSLTRAFFRELARVQPKSDDVLTAYFGCEEDAIDVLLEYGLPSESSLYYWSTATQALFHKRRPRAEGYSVICCAVIEDERLLSHRGDVFHLSSLADRLCLPLFRMHYRRVALGSSSSSPSPTIEDENLVLQEQRWKEELAMPEASRWFNMSHRQARVRLTKERQKERRQERNDLERAQSKGFPANTA